MIYARREDRVTSKGVSLAIPVNRLEWFLSRPEITFARQIIARSDAGKPVEFKAALKSLFVPRDPLEIEFLLRDASGQERRYRMSLR